MSIVLHLEGIIIRYPERTSEYEKSLAWNWHHSNPKYLLKNDKKPKMREKGEVLHSGGEEVRTQKPKMGTGLSHQ